MTREILRALLGLLVLFACGVVPTDCPPLSQQWEQSSYAVDATRYTDAGIGLDGDGLDARRVDAIADAVDACLGARGHVDRGCTTVATVRGEPSCSRPGLWLLPVRAPEAICDAKGAEQLVDCPCRYAVATQDGGRTVIVPAQQPYERLAEGLVRVATSELYPWSDPVLAGCSVITL